jgi:hypothetical protein
LHQPAFVVKYLAEFHFAALLGRGLLRLFTNTETIFCLMASINLLVIGSIFRAQN